MSDDNDSTLVVIGMSADGEIVRRGVYGFSTSRQDWDFTEPIEAIRKHHPDVVEIAMVLKFPPPTVM